MAGISSKAAGKLQNKYGITGKEMQNNEFSDGSGLEEYDFGARFYDSQIGRWKTIDPLSIKYINLSPYNYCNNNPVLYLDYNGMSFTDEAEKAISDLAKRYNGKLNNLSSKIEENKKRISDTKTSKGQRKRLENENARKTARFDKLSSEIKDINGEISVLRSSLQVYDIRFDNTNNVVDKPTGTSTTGQSYYESETHMVVMSLPSFDDDRLVHELDHFYQFETGLMSLTDSKTHGVAGGGLWDIFDELEAYRREAVYSDTRQKTMSEILNDPLYANINTSNRAIPDEYRKNSTSPEAIKWIQNFSIQSQGHAMRLGNTTYFTPLNNRK